MFKNKLIFSLVVLETMSVVCNAVVPNATGPYIGVSKLSSSSVHISSKDNSNNENGFYVSIYDYSTSTLFKRITVSASTSNTLYAQITGLTCDKTYKAEIIAFNTDGNSSKSDARYFNLKSTFGASCLETTPSQTVQELALAKIAAYATDNINPMPTLQDYNDVPVTGVTSANLNQINNVIAALLGTEVDTQVELQEVIDNITPPSETTLNAPGPYIAVSKIADSSNSVRIGFKDNSNNEDGFSIKDIHGTTIQIYMHPNNSNYFYATLTGLSCDKVYQIQAMAHKNTIISEASPLRAFRISSTLGVECPVETPKELALAKIAAYAHNNANPIPTVQDYADTGVTLKSDYTTQGITLVNLNKMNQLIDNLEQSDVDTDDKLYSIWLLNLKCLDKFELMELLQNSQSSDINMSNVNTSCITDMSGLFEFTRSFNQDISKWNVSNVTNMSGMFQMRPNPALTNNVNPNISDWNVSNVTDMSAMFRYNRKFNQDLTNWDTNKVTNMREMFLGAKRFKDNNLSNWNVSNVSNHIDFSNGWGTGNTEPIW